MKYYLYYDEQGEIVRTIGGREDTIVVANIPGLTLLEFDGTNYEDAYILNNELTQYSEVQKLAKFQIPNYPSRWDNSSMNWIDLRPPEFKLAMQLDINTRQRDSLLQQSDWRVVKAADIGVPISQEWKDYRQALRDITLQSDPFSIVWPTPPLPQP